MRKSESRFGPSQLAPFLRYDDDSGLLFWRIRHEGMPYGDWTVSLKAARRFNACHAGKSAGYTVDGYRMIRIFQHSFRFSRVVWALHHNVWPDLILDHIDGNPLNNRIENLREVTFAENARNQGLRRDNMSGHTGVSFHKRVGKWAARIKIGGGDKHLGYFDAFEDACSCRQKASVLYGYHPNHGRTRFG
jgi:hypothetical protein